MIFSFAGISSSDSFSGSEALCTAENFTPAKWLTLGRTDLEDPPHCPLVGEYTGILPDAEGLCARSYADCNNPEVMFYTVYNCGNASEVYEEREYRCFGQWSEPDTGLVYTYTERRDIPGKECFVGVTMDDDERHMVTEAGHNCERGHQPRKYGMTLQRQSKCPNSLVIKTNPNQQRPRPRIPITPRPKHGSSLGTERPVSPRLTSSGSNVKESIIVDGVEQLLEKIEEDEFEREFTSTYRPNPRHKHKHNGGGGHRGHRNNNNRNANTSDQDILTNQIPGSRRMSPHAGNSGFSAARSVPIKLIVSLILIQCLFQRQTR